MQWDPFGLHLEASNIETCLHFFMPKITLQNLFFQKNTYLITKGKSEKLCEQPFYDEVYPWQDLPSDTFYCIG